MEQQQDTGAAALMLHGAGGGGWEWGIWSGIWSQAGYRVIAPDLLPAPGGLEMTTLDDYVTQVSARIRSLDRPVVIGASLGAVLALAAAKNTETDRLILVNPAIPGAVGQAAPAARNPIKRWANRPAIGTLQDLPDGDYYAACYATARWRDESAAVLAALQDVELMPPTVPTLVLWGRAHTTANVPQARAFADRLGADFLAIEGATHLGLLLGRHAARAASIALATTRQAHP